MTKTFANYLLLFLLFVESSQANDCDHVYPSAVSKATILNGTHIRRGCDAIIKAGPAGTAIELALHNLTLGWGDASASSELDRQLDWLRLYCLHPSGDQYRFAKMHDNIVDGRKKDKAQHRFVVGDGDVRLSLRVVSTPTSWDGRRLKADSTCGCPPMVVDVAMGERRNVSSLGFPKPPACAHQRQCFRLFRAPIGGSIELHIAKEDVQLDESTKFLLEVHDGNGTVDVDRRVERYSFITQRARLPAEGGEVEEDVVVLSTSRELRLIARYPEGHWDGGYKGIIRALPSPCADACGKDTVLEAAVGERKELLSPNYHNGSCGGIQCSWIIRAPPGHLLKCGKSRKAPISQEQRKALKIHEYFDSSSEGWGIGDPRPSAKVFLDSAATRPLRTLYGGSPTFHVVGGSAAVTYATRDEVTGFLGKAAKFRIRYSAEPKEPGCSCPGDERGAAEGVVRFSSECERLTCHVFVHPPASFARGTEDIVFVARAVGRTGAYTKGRTGLLQINPEKVADPWARPHRDGTAWAQATGEYPSDWTAEGGTRSFVMTRPVHPVALQFSRDGEELGGDLEIAYQWRQNNCSCDVSEIRLDRAGESANWSTPQFPHFPFCPNTTCVLQIKAGSGLGMEISFASDSAYLGHKDFLYFLRHSGQSCEELLFRVSGMDTGYGLRNNSRSLACTALGLDASAAADGDVFTHTGYEPKPFFLPWDVRLVFKAGPEFHSRGFRVIVKAVELSAMGLVRQSGSAGSVFLGMFLGVLLFALLAVGACYWRRRGGAPVRHIAGSVFLGMFLGVLLFALLAVGACYWRRRGGAPVRHIAFDPRGGSGEL